MGSNIRLIAFAVVLLVGAGFAFKHRGVLVPASSMSAGRTAESATQTVSHAEELSERITREAQQATQTLENKPQARVDGMHKCVGGSSTTYTADDCPPGTKQVAMRRGTVTTMKTNLDGVVSSEPGIPNAREPLNSDDATHMQELKDKRMDAIIEGRRP